MRSHCAKLGAFPGTAPAPRSSEAKLRVRLLAAKQAQSSTNPASVGNSPCGAFKGAWFFPHFRDARFCGCRQEEPTHSPTQEPQRKPTEKIFTPSLALMCSPRSQKSAARQRKRQM
ncbi:hypothetical protein WMY93_033647 [Mugilogobius chulae]|uniref:Uncharacterized protein n=1 Tax=Mugilogobius chulae TaxID=88201 RepID=A0AAW0MSM6_9GOBI